MNRDARWFLVAGASNAALAVVLGAFGAHALKGRLAEDLATVYGTAVQYHFIHALGLMIVGLIFLHVPASAVRVSGWIMLGGTIVFCGSLYVLSVTGIRWLGAITPIGGIAFITSWIVLAVALLRAPELITHRYDRNGV